jgi:ADP-ribosylglycohydrolase
MDAIKLKTLNRVRLQIMCLKWAGVLIAFQDALWQLLHAASREEGVVDTLSRGGDTDTNATICGALLGSVYGRDYSNPMDRVSESTSARKRQTKRSST